MSIGRRGGPLADVRVLELGTLIAGPFAGRIFSDFGAEVIKIEHPERGDPLRTWGMAVDGADSLWHLVQSRGKLSVSADLHNAEDQAFVRQLALQSDVLIENFRPGRLERWTLDPDSLLAESPELIVVRISGYGQTGPMRDQPAFGTIAEAAGGLRFITGDPGRPPARVGLSLGDSIASLHAVIGALIALHEREKSGRGQVVDVALTDSMLAMLEGILPEYGYYGAVRQRTGNIAHNSAPTNAYACADGTLVCIAANTTALFHILCTVLGRPDYLADPDLATNEGRVNRAVELDDAISGWTRTRAADDVVRTLLDHKIPVSRINSIADIAADPQFKARQMIVEIVDERLERPLLTPGVVPKLSRTPGRVPPLAQPLGEATAEVRRRFIEPATSPGESRPTIGAASEAFTVPTYRGPVHAADLGPTLIHEHIFVRNPELEVNLPDREWDPDDATETAVRELNELHTMGIRTIVDLTVPGLGRDAHMISRVAERVPVHVVAATGWYTSNVLPVYFQFHGPAQPLGGPDPLVELFVRDLRDGIAGTSVRAGMIKVMSDADGMTSDVRRVMAAAAEAYQETGASITTHSHPASRNGLEQQAFLGKCGVAADRIIIGHCGDTEDVDYLAEIMDRGSTIGMDRFGMEHVLPDDRRVRTVIALLERGYADRMVLSHDAAIYSHVTPPSWRARSAPAWRMDTISRRILPTLRDAGASEREIRQMMVDNPQRLLGGVR